MDENISSAEKNTNIFTGEDFTSIPIVELSNKSVLSFKGGGGKGNAYLGVIKVLEKLDYGGILPLQPTNKNKQIVGIGGASAGAITSLALALGMTSNDIENVSNKKTSEFLFRGGFEFADFMANDVANPGSYRAVEISKINGGFKASIGFTHDTIYKDDFLDIKSKAKKNRQDEVGLKQEQIIKDVKDFLSKNDESNYADYGSSVKRRKLKKIAAIKIQVAGGGFSTTPKFDSTLKALNEKSLFNEEGIFNGKIRDIMFFLARLKPLLSKNDPILGALKSKESFQNHIYNIFYDRGMFCGTYVRTYFKRLIHYYLNLYHSSEYAKVVKNYSEDEHGALTFKEFFQVTGIDLRIGGTNLTAGENVIFSRVHTPYFPVCEAVGLSMNIPGVFTPVYIKSKDQNGKELEGTNLKSGLYVDSGLTNNMPMRTFIDNSPYLDETKVSPESIFGFRVFDGPNPNTFKKFMPYIWDNSKFYSDDNRLLYSKYLLDYFQKNDQLPTRLSPITYYDIPSAPRGVFGTTLLKMLGYTLDTVLNASTLNDLTEDLNKNIVDVYSYNITTMDFTPDSNLLKFVVNQAEIRANALLKYTASLNKN